MTFINPRVVEASAPLKAAHFPFPRGEELFEAMSWCTTVNVRLPAVAS